MLIAGWSTVSIAQEGGQIREPMTIEQALNIAEQDNPALKQLKLTLESYQLQLVARRASLKSQFSLDLSPVSYNRGRRFDTRVSQWYTNETFNTSGTFRVDQPILLTDGTISLINTFGWQSNESSANELSTNDERFSNNLYLRLQQPLFTYNTRKMALQRLEAQYENAGIDYAIRRLQTESSITEQFYNVYLDQSQLDISKEELKNSEQSYEIIKNKVESELLAKEKLFEAELNLANAQLKVENSAVTLENDKDILKQTLGIPLSDEISVIAEIVVDPVAVDLVRAIRHGLESRMELRRRELAIDEAELKMIEIKDENKFKGDVSLSVGIVGDNSKISKIYSTPEQNPSIVVNFTVPVFDWGARRARIRAQKAEQTIAKLEYNDQKTDIELNVRTTWRTLENTRSQIDIQEKTVRNAQLTYDLNLTRYREGEITGMQISQYQTQLTDAKLTYSRTLINYKKQLLNLKILSLYDFEKDEPVVPVKEITLENNN
jgi:outer membrane protein TolC